MLRTLFPMQPKFKLEDESEKYLSPEKRAEYLSTINEDGQLLNQAGDLLTDDKLMYVVSEQLELYVVPAEACFNHSFILAGAPVLAAGFLLTDEEAHIIHLDNNSGHYCPTMQGMMFVINYLYVKSSSHAKYIVEFENHDQLPSRGVITTYDMGDLLEQLKEAEQEASFEEVIERVGVVSKIDSRASKQELSVDGYDELDEKKEESLVSFSRFGRNPKGWSARMGLFRVAASAQLTNELARVVEGCRITL